jgi:hypothetical protein
LSNKYDPILGEYRQKDSTPETDPLSVHLDQTTPQQMSGGDFGGSGKIGVSSGTLVVDSVDYFPAQAIIDTAHYTGFPNRDDTTLAFVAGALGATRTLTISGTNWNFWINGVEYTVASTLTKQIADTTGLYWFWITIVAGVPTLNASTTHPGFDKCLVATVYWNTTTDAGITSDERHWMGRDQWNHEYLHETIGARYASGLAGTFGDSSFVIGLGEFYDEDIEHEIDEQTLCKVLYHNGSAAWEWDSSSAVPYKVVGGGDNNLRYNSGNSLATVGNNKYVNYWVFITADVDHPVHVFIGTAEYVTLALARAATLPSFGALASAEDKPIFKVTYQNNGGTPDYIETTDYRSSSNLPSTSYVATDHGSLAGLLDDDHPQYFRILSKSFIISNPTADADGPVWRTPEGITITAVHALCVGGNNVIGQLWVYDTNGANGAAIDADITALAGTNVNDDGAISSPTAGTGAYIGWRTTSVSGTPTKLIVTFEYQKT